ARARRALRGDVHRAGRRVRTRGPGFVTGRLAAFRSRLDALAGVAWRAAPGLTIYCAAFALVAGVLGVAYPIGFRIIVDGALEHDRRKLVFGVLVASA